MIEKLTYCGFGVVVILGFAACGKKKPDPIPVQPPPPTQCSADETKCLSTCKTTVAITATGQIIEFLDPTSKLAASDGPMSFKMESFTPLGVQVLDSETIEQGSDGTYNSADLDVTCVSKVMWSAVDDLDNSSSNLFVSTFHPLAKAYPTSDIAAPTYVLTEATKDVINSALGRTGDYDIEVVGATIAQFLDADGTPVSGVTLQPPDQSTATIEYPMISGGDGMSTDDTGTVVLTSVPLDPSGNTNFVVIPPASSTLTFDSVYFPTKSGGVTLLIRFPQ